MCYGYLSPESHAGPSLALCPFDKAQLTRLPNMAGPTKIWRNWSPQTVLFAINVFAAVAIFFEGYDQGVMGGVNGSPDYQKVVNLGSGDGVVTRPTKQGGLVAVYCEYADYTNLDHLLTFL